MESIGAPILLLRICIVFIISFAFGMYRQRRHKPIGFGTYTFVAAGSCSVAVAAFMIEPDNPLPLLSAIITGIGFLGAGALVRNNDRVLGFTSAASIWAFAIIGLCIGVGAYGVGLLLYFVIWAVTFVDVALEKRGFGSYQRRIRIVAQDSFSEDDVISTLCEFGKKYEQQAMIVDNQEKQVTYEYVVQARKKEVHNLARKLNNHTGILHIRIE